MADLVTLADIEAAAERIAGQVVRTPTVPSPGLTALLGAPVTAKLELRASRNQYIVVHGRHYNGAEYRIDSEPLAALPPMWLDYLRAQLSLAMSTEDIVEGVQAFFDKREPQWKGR